MQRTFRPAILSAEFFLHLRSSNKSFSQVIKSGNEFDKEAYTLLNTFEGPHFDLKLPFIHLTDVGQKQKLTGGLLEPRHQYFLEQREIKRLQQGFYSEGE
jgi:hypothetical protein